MSDQLTLDIEAPARVYTCCGQPCCPLQKAYTNGGRDDEPGRRHAHEFPHAEDCPNPSIGVWIDRYNRTIRSLWCGDGPRLGGPCPYGGSFPQSPNTHDPYNGQCCKNISRATTTGGTHGSPTSN